jgi:Pregnancy-associated plasma protein-A/Secretion system C-terminal sorting domain
MKLNCIFIFLLFSKVLSSQKATCGIDAFYFEKVFKSEGLKEEALKALLSKRHQNEINARSILMIPVVFHIVYSEEAENICDDLIHSQMDKLNQDYAFENADKASIPSAFKNIATNTDIQFCLAHIDTMGKPTSGITRTRTNQKGIGLTDDLFFTEKGGQTAWNTERYLNIWVVDLGTKITGFAAMPLLTAAYRDGVVLHYKYTGFNKDDYYGLGRVGVHEVGHYLGLTHIWGTKNGCDDDDGIDDTPQQATNYSGCPSFPKTSCGVSNMFMNYMDYVDDPCMLMFTQGQKERMVGTLKTSRKSLLTANICVKPTSFAEQTKITLFPNPFSDKITVEANQYLNEIISVYATDGKLVLTKIINNNKITFCVGDLPAGLYIIKLANKNFKLVKH